MVEFQELLVVFLMYCPAVVVSKLVIVRVGGRNHFRLGVAVTVILGEVVVNIYYSWEGRVVMNVM